MSDASTAAAVEMKLTAAIVDVSRTLARSVPTPRGAPYFLLDSDTNYDLRIFDSLSARGIFRKYEFALDIGSGLGGRARWLAVRTGCSILGVDPSLLAVSAARALNRRAHLDNQVRFQVGRFEHLPVRDRVFTHVWMLDAASVPGPTLAEAVRVLRGGGHLALQCAAAPATRRTELIEALSALGLAEIEIREVALAEPPDVYRIARDRLQSVLCTHPEAPALLQRLPAPPQAGTRWQVFARRAR